MRAQTSQEVCKFPGELQGTEAKTAELGITWDGESAEKDPEKNKECGISEQLGDSRPGSPGWEWRKQEFPGRVSRWGMKYCHRLKVFNRSRGVACENLRCHGPFRCHVQVMFITVSDRLAEFGVICNFPKWLWSQGTRRIYKELAGMKWPGKLWGRCQATEGGKRVLEIRRQLNGWGGQWDGTVCSGEDQRTGQAMFSLGEEDGKRGCWKDERSEEVCSPANCKGTPLKAYECGAPFWNRIAARQEVRMADQDVAPLSPAWAPRARTGPAGEGRGSRVSAPAYFCTLRLLTNGSRGSASVSQGTRGKWELGLGTLFWELSSKAQPCGSCAWHSTTALTGSLYDQPCSHRCPERPCKKRRALWFPWRQQILHAYFLKENQQSFQLGN